MTLEEYKKEFAKLSRQMCKEHGLCTSINIRVFTTKEASGNNIPKDSVYAVKCKFNFLI